MPTAKRAGQKVLTLRGAMPRETTAHQPLCADSDGFAQSELDRVFEPFYRVEDSRSRETGGTGLGLAIVRQIARSHRGEVRLENLKCGGLRAVMELPFDGASSRPPLAQPRRTPAEPPST